MRQANLTGEGTRAPETEGNIDDLKPGQTRPDFLNSKPWTPWLELPG